MYVFSFTHIKGVGIWNPVEASVRAQASNGLLEAAAAAHKQILPGRQADPARSPGGCWGGCCLGPAGSRPAARRLLRQQPGSIRSTAPLRNRT